MHDLFPVRRGPALPGVLIVLSLLFGGSPTGPAEAEARVWLVRPDGTGDLPTIAATLNAAAPRDTIDLAAGVHQQTARLMLERKTLLIRGAGIDQTIIQAPTHGNLLHLRGPGNETEIRDLTLRGAVADQIGDPLGLGTDGGAINAEAANFTLTRVRITECRAGVGGGLGGGIFMTSLERHAGGGIAGRRPLADGYILLDEVTIDHCGSGSEGGGLYAEGAVFVLRNCRFESNDAVDGGGVKIFNSVGIIEECLFRDNVAAFYGGGLKVEQSLDALIRVEGNTFVGNRAERGGAGVELFRTVNVTLKRNIFVGQAGAGDPWECRTPGDFVTECNLIFENGNRERLDCPTEATLIEADPRFCNAAAGDFRLCSDSPAIGGACGRRGAFDVGCSGTGCVTPVVSTTWGGLKARYDR